MDVDRPRERVVERNDDDKAQGHQKRKHARHGNLRKQVLASEEERETDRQQRACEKRDPDDVGHKPGCEMKPDAPGRRHVVDLPEDLRHVRHVSCSGLIERHRRRVESVESLRDPVSFGFEAHRKPFLVDRRLEVVDKRRSQGDRLGFFAVGITKERSGGARFLGDRCLRVVKLFPHNDDREGKKHSIDDAHSREFETGDFVVFDQRLDANPAADQNLRGHRQSGRNNHN